MLTGSRGEGSRKGRGKRGCREKRTLLQRFVSWEDTIEWIELEVCGRMPTYGRGSGKSQMPTGAGLPRPLFELRVKSEELRERMAQRARYKLGLMIVWVRLYGSKISARLAWGLRSNSRSSERPADSAGTAIITSRFLKKSHITNTDRD